MQRAALCAAPPFSGFRIPLSFGDLVTVGEHVANVNVDGSNPFTRFRARR